MEFRDHFSQQSEVYAKARPTYPKELFQYLAGIAPSHELCWDCATGNGQAAVSLADYFRKVIATDGSPQQITHAVAKQNIEYRVAVAEKSSLQNSAADLVTVATAAHWLELALFYKEAERVLKPNGVLALWTYSSAAINSQIDELMEWFAYTFLYHYWPDGRWYVRQRYETLPFPYTATATPKFFSRADWTKQQWLNYLRSWSAYNNFIAKNSTDPIEALLPELNKLWNDTETKEVVWPLHLKCTQLNRSR